MPWFPVAGKSLAIDLANSAYYANGVVQDGLTGPAELTSWFAAVAPRLGFAPPTATRALHADAIALRSAVRAVLASVVDGTAPRPAAVRTLNAATRAAPTWPELTVADGGLDTVVGVPDRRRAALSVVAADAISLVCGPDRARLRTCDGSGCLGFLLQADPRQHFCSPRCATRLRAARHYRRAR